MSLSRILGDKVLRRAIMHYLTEVASSALSTGALEGL